MDKIVGGIILIKTRLRLREKAWLGFPKPSGMIPSEDPSK